MRSWKRTVRRGFGLVLLPFAVLLVLFDDLFRGWVKPAVARLAALAPFRRLEAWIRTLSPYQTAALFLIPMVVIWPLKLFALYLIGGGHIVSGLLVLVMAKGVGVGIAERLFAVSRDKLLSIGWFAAGFAFAVRMHAVVHDFLRRTRAWAIAGRIAARARAALATIRDRLRALAGGRGDLVGGARRIVSLYHRRRGTGTR